MGIFSQGLHSFIFSGCSRNGCSLLIGVLFKARHVLVRIRLSQIVAVVI